MADEKAGDPRTEHVRVHSEPLSRFFQRTVARAGTVIGALGVFLVIGIVVAAVCTLLFGELAEHVMAGSTQAFDETVLRWIAPHRTPMLDGTMLEITALGTGTVVMMIVAVSGLFLWLTQHRYSAILLLASTAGGIALNGLLKIRFDRPRPHVISWGAHAVSSSFPSGHVMSATIVYGTVAYLAARLQQRVWARWTTMGFALIVIILIALSRIYLGVHYPSDVLAGATIGLAWAGFCMAMLEAVQRLAQRTQPALREHEKPAPAATDR
jgi:undecaprenyl-diphosphatase